MARRRILVVDDEPGMLRAVQRVLERSYDVTCAASAEEALGRIDQFRPDLAILDIRMPGTDGFELMARLKEALPHLDVILMTGSASEPERKLVRAIREKAFYFIQKPFDREVLQTLVERCLELKRLEEENRRHVERLENVLSEARAFQSSLLPEPGFRDESVSIAANYSPCETLCGDLFDYAPCGPGRMSFVVADVSGHGAAAAMLTGIVKSAFRSCRGEDYEPRDVVERISAGIRTFRPNRFVTLFCGIVGREELSYVNAGHPPGLLRAAGEDLVMLGSTGPLVSPVLDQATWRQQRRPFPPGSRLVLFTDGITEAPGESEMFGLERFRGLVDAAGGTGAALIDDVLGGVLAHMRGRKPDDDMTMLVLDRL